MAHRGTTTHHRTIMARMLIMILIGDNILKIRLSMNVDRITTLPLRSREMAVRSMCFVETERHKIQSIGQGGVMEINSNGMGIGIIFGTK